jgi:hypothetical protein
LFVTLLLDASLAQAQAAGETRPSLAVTFIQVLRYARWLWILLITVLSSILVFNQYVNRSLQKTAR